MTSPLWVNTASNHAVVKKKELQEWLGVNSKQLLIMVKEQGFPKPRFGNFEWGRGATERNVFLSVACRWRVGDVRAWLAGTARLAKELSTPIAVERSETSKTLASRGFDPFKGWGA